MHEHVKFHVVRLSLEEVRRRWPARDERESHDFGFDPNAAARDKWQVGAPPCHFVQKTLACTGTYCGFCAKRIDADDVP